MTTDPIIDQLQARRKAAGLSYAKLAALCGTSPATLHHYFAGSKHPGLGVLRRIVTALDADCIVIDRGAGKNN